ncbi:MAG: TetR family transcriptional regulator [Myxococcaceae bacterium]|nr:TetR family transcriptional regulator [Myxococcaceae bacterium]
MAAKALAQQTTREQDRRRTILRAAVEVFSKKGYHGCRIADVAREAGVAYGLVYHYFKNKDELLESVFTSGWSGFVERLTEQASKSTTFEDRVRGVVGVAFDAYKHDPRGVKVLILEVGRSPSGGAVNRGSAFSDVIRLASLLFQEAKEKGHLKADMDPLLAATMLFGAIEMGLTAFVLGLLDRKDDSVLDRARDQVAETFLRGVVPAGTAQDPTSRAGQANPAVRSKQTWTSSKSPTKSRAQRRA